MDVGADPESAHALQPEVVHIEESHADNPQQFSEPQSVDCDATENQGHVDDDSEVEAAAQEESSGCAEYRPDMSPESDADGHGVRTLWADECDSNDCSDHDSRNEHGDHNDGG